MVRETPCLFMAMEKQSQMVSNCLVSTVSGLPFKCSGSSSFSPVEMSGTCNLSTNGAQLSILLRVGGEPDSKAPVAANIETEVLTPLEHFVLLGMMPTS